MKLYFMNTERLGIKNRNLDLKIIACFFLMVVNTYVYAQKKTKVSISVPANPVQIDTMIYGQMLENVNDSVIYRGVVSEDGTVRANLIPVLKDLDIPVMRWPGGTVIHEYHWREGIGPKHLRPVVETHAWKGKETYQFGTDEFLKWCKEVGTTPYINFNMANNAEYGGTLGEAMNWIEYVNGSPDTTNFGKLRAAYGHTDPYNVLYWGIGNENYGPWGKHSAETAFGYGERLKLWANAINQKFSGLKLLGIGHTAEWNKVVLEKAGTEIDYLTQHYYVASKFKEDKVEDPYNSLFAPVKMEKHLRLLGDHLKYYNSQNRQGKDPVRLSIDEWNNRHSVFDGKAYKFSRQDPRRLLDAAVAAGMLNVFIRNADIVGMANYIFPVNGHGLIRTNGNNDAFKTPLYYLFQKYREAMVGQRLNITVEGSGMAAAGVHPSIEGDCAEVIWGNEHLSFIDAAASRTSGSIVNVALVNRSYDLRQLVAVTVPEGYTLNNRWELSGKNINEYNSLENRNTIVPGIIKENKREKGTLDIMMDPCAVVILSFAPNTK